MAQETDYKQDFNDYANAWKILKKSVKSEDYVCVNCPRVRIVMVRTFLSLTELTAGRQTLIFLPVNSKLNVKSQRNHR